jgi:hypothetical protein
MNMMRLFLLFLLLSLSIGCKTFGPSRHETEKAYAVRVILVDVPATLLDELNLSWMFGKAGTRPTTAEFEYRMAKLFSSPQADITKFPVVYVNAGERKKIDKQKPVKYPTTYTWDGKPTVYETRGVGRFIEIDLKSVTDGWATCKYYIEDIDVTGYTSHNIPNVSRKIKQPIFRLRSVSTESESGESDIQLSLNDWQIMGGMILKSDNGTNYSFFTIQVQENKKAQPTNSPYSSPSTGSKR